MDFSEGDETLFQSVQRPYVLIFWILCIEKCDFDEDASVMF
jgi:hypothetical protein